MTTLLELMAKGLQRIWSPIVRFIAVPRWVRTFPYEADRVGLTNLALATKGRLAEPREMVFVLSNFSGKEKAENAVFAIEQQGWECKTQPQEGAPGKTILECRRTDYEITEETYAHDIAYFNRIAHMYGADNDGWYAGGRAKMGPKARQRLRVGAVASFVVLIWALRMVVVWHIFATVHAPSQATAQNTNASQAQTVPIDSRPAPLPDTDPKKIGANDSLTPMGNGLSRYRSEAFGISMQIPDAWMMVVSQPCVAAQNGGEQECQVQLFCKNWHERYVPTILLARFKGDLQAAEHMQDRQYAALQLQNPSILVTKTITQVDGQPSIVYTETSYGTTTEKHYIQAAGSVFLVQGETPKSQPAGMDYFVVLHDMIESVSVNR